MWWWVSPAASETITASIRAAAGESGFSLSRSRTARARWINARSATVGKLAEPLRHRGVSALLLGLGLRVPAVSLIVYPLRISG
jgi:hypothetical protein